MQPLPNEIWLRIFRILRKREWLFLSGTCALFRPLAQTALFESVKLRVTEPVDDAELRRDDSTKRDNKVYSLFSWSITERPMLGDLVGTFKITHCYASMCPSYPILRELASLPNLHTLWLQRFSINSELCHIFRQLHRLDTITFEDCKADDADLREYSQQPWCSPSVGIVIACSTVDDGWSNVIPPGLRFLKLEIGRDEFDYGGERKWSLNLSPPALRNLHTLSLQTDIPTNIVPFLMSSPELRRITLPGGLPKDSYGLRSLPSHAIPKLEHFSGDAKYAEIFLKARPVHTVAIFYEKRTSSNILKCLKLSTVPVTTLELHVDGLGGHKIPAKVLKHAPTTVRHLFFGLHHASVLLSWLPMLAKMPDLQVLRGTSLDSDRHKELVLAASKACKSLREFVFEVHPWSVSWYETWYRRQDGAWGIERSWMSNED